MEADGSVAHAGDLLAATAPSILDVAFLCGAVYLKLFGYGCFEPQDKSQQTDRRLLPHLGSHSCPLETLRLPHQEV